MDIIIIGLILYGVFTFPMAALSIVGLFVLVCIVS